jgi:predicted outer membrane repeat protein
MRGLPFPSSVTKSTFCVPPGDFTLHAVDTAGDGWWGGAYYSLILGGATVIQEEMGQISSTKQSTTFTVALPKSAFTTFTGNTAPQGGGGAIFWEDVPTENIERYRNKSTSNAARYGDYVATPARELLMATGDATSGRNTTTTDEAANRWE